MEIRVVARQGQSIQQIARELGCSRNTVRKYLREPEPVGYDPRALRPSKLDAYKPYPFECVERVRPQWIPATVLLRGIRGRLPSQLWRKCQALLPLTEINSDNPP